MAKVNRAVIAAAGLNSRFLPVSKGVTKGLIPILEKPAVQYLVEELVGAGIGRIAIVHNHGDPSIKRYFTPDAGLKKALVKKGKIELLGSLETIWEKTKELKFVPQPRARLPYGNATPLLVMKNWLGNEPFVYMFGDDMVVENKPGESLGHLIKAFDKNRPAAVVAVQKVPREEISRYASVEYVKKPHYPNQAAQFLEKLPASQAPSLSAQIGRFVYSPEIWNILAKIKPEKKSNGPAELWLADANNLLAQTGVVIAEPLTYGTWITTGDPQRWLMANLAIAWKDKGLRKEIREFIKILPNYSN